MNLSLESEDSHKLSGPHQGLQIVAKLCSAGGCPTIYRTPTGELLVQGYTVSGDGEVDLPDGEGLVRIPQALLAEAIHSMR